MLRTFFRQPLTILFCLNVRHKYPPNLCTQPPKTSPKPTDRISRRVLSEFGTDSWACHQRCDDYTHWRVCKPEDVPDAETPESWGRREDWLAHVRQTRLREMANVD
jgi:hypothetical protein